jgi:hypothetical protein
MLPPLEAVRQSYKKAEHKTTCMLNRFVLLDRSPAGTCLTGPERLIGERLRGAPGLHEGVQRRSIVQVHQEATDSDSDLAVAGAGQRRGRLDSDVLVSLHDGLCCHPELVVVHPGASGLDRLEVPGAGHVLDRAVTDEAFMESPLITTKPGPQMRTGLVVTVMDTRSPGAEQQQARTQRTCRRYGLGRPPY